MFYYYFFNFIIIAFSLLFHLLTWDDGDADFKLEFSSWHSRLTFTCWNLSITINAAVLVPNQLEVNWTPSVSTRTTINNYLTPPGGHSCPDTLPRPLCPAATHVLMFPPSLSHNAEMGRLSLTGTRMRTGTIGWSAASALACACELGWDVSSPLVPQRGHVLAHSMFSIPTTDDYLLPTVTPQTRVPYWAALSPNGKSEPGGGSM